MFHDERHRRVRGSLREGPVRSAAFRHHDAVHADESWVCVRCHVEAGKCHRRYGRARALACVVFFVVLLSVFQGRQRHGSDGPLGHQLVHLHGAQWSGQLEYGRGSDRDGYLVSQTLRCGEWRNSKHRNARGFCDRGLQVPNHNIEQRGGGVLHKRGSTHLLG